MIYQNSVANVRFRNYRVIVRKARFFPQIFSSGNGVGLTRLVLGRVVTLVGNFDSLALLKASFCHYKHAFNALNEAIYVTLHCNIR